jgi:hypothetical protein
VHGRNYSLRAVARQSFILIQNGSASDTVIDVAIAGGLTSGDVMSSNAACALLPSSVASGSLTFVCRQLPLGATTIGFWANKTGACLLSCKTGYLFVFKWHR